MISTLLAGLTKSQKDELELLGISASRRSDWKAGRRMPTAAQMMVLATITKTDPIPLLFWLADQEANPAQRDLFRQAKARGFWSALTVILSVALLTPKQAESSVSIAHNAEPSRPDSLHIVDLLRRLARAATSRTKALFLGMNRPGLASITAAC